MLSTVLMVVVVFAAMYFLMIRPANKRMKEQQDTISAIQPGSRVLLTSGMFATVRHVGDKQMVVELAPDCVVTVLKGAVTKVVTPDEEEFEYEDSTAADTGLASPVAGAAGDAHTVTGEVVEPAAWSPNATVARDANAETDEPATWAVDGADTGSQDAYLTDSWETQAEPHAGPEFTDPREGERR